MSSSSNNNNYDNEEIKAAGMEDNEVQGLGLVYINQALVIKDTAVEARPWNIISAPTSGDTFTVASTGSNGRYVLNNASSLNAYTLVLPNPTFNGHIVEFLSVGGVTALTLNPSASNKYLGTAPTAIASGKKVSFSWNKGAGQWIVLP